MELSGVGLHKLLNIIGGEKKKKNDILIAYTKITSILLKKKKKKEKRTSLLNDVKLKLRLVFSFLTGKNQDIIYSLHPIFAVIFSILADLNANRNQKQFMKRPTTVKK